MHSSVLKQTEFDLSKINWLCGVILFHSNSVGALGHVSIVSYPYQIYFGFPGSNLNLDYGLCDHVITRFTSNNHLFIGKMIFLFPSHCLVPKTLWSLYPNIFLFFLLFFYFFEKAFEKDNIDSIRKINNFKNGGLKGQHVEKKF